MSNDPFLPPDGMPGADPGPLGGGAMPDMGGLLEQAMQMQQQLLDAQAKAAETEVEGHAGGGVVRVKMTGDLDVLSVRIAPELLDPAEVEMLQDLVVAAVRDAIANAEQVRAASMGGGMPDPGELLSGLGLGGAPGGDPLGGLSELLGGASELGDIEGEASAEDDPSS